MHKVTKRVLLFLSSLLILLGIGGVYNHITVNADLTDLERSNALANSYLHLSNVYLDKYKMTGEQDPSLLQKSQDILNKASNVYNNSNNDSNLEDDSEPDETDPGYNSPTGNGLSYADYHNGNDGVNQNDQLANDESVPDSNSDDSNDSDQATDSSDNDNESNDDSDDDDSDQIDLSSFHKGLPRQFGRSTIWLSDFRKFNNDGQHGYYRDVEGLGNFGRHNYGFNPTPLEYSNHKKYVTTGADASAGMAIDPYYQSLGDGTYGIMSGNHSLNGDYNDLFSSGDYDDSPAIYVKVKFHGNRAMTVWNMFDNQGDYNQTYMGYYRKTPYHTWKTFNKALFKINNGMTLPTYIKRYFKNNIGHNKSINSRFVNRFIIPLISSHSRLHKRYFPILFGSEVYLWKNMVNKFGHIINVFHRTNHSRYRYLGEVIHLNGYRHLSIYSKRLLANIALNHSKAPLYWASFISSFLGLGNNNIDDLNNLWSSLKAISHHTTKAKARQRESLIIYKWFNHHFKYSYYIRSNKLGLNMY